MVVFTILIATCLVWWCVGCCVRGLRAIMRYEIKWIFMLYACSNTERSGFMMRDPALFKLVDRTLLQLTKKSAASEMTLTSTHRRLTHPIISSELVPRGTNLKDSADIMVRTCVLSLC